MKRTTIATEEFILLWTMTVSNLLQIGVGE